MFQKKKEENGFDRQELIDATDSIVLGDKIGSLIRQLKGIRFHLKLNMCNLEKIWKIHFQQSNLIVKSHTGNFKNYSKCI